MEEGTLREAKAGSRDALEAILQEVQPQIYRFGLRMCRHPEDAEDVLQETMLAVAKNLETFRGEGKFSTWAFSIARSFCIKKRRRKVGEPPASEVAHLDAVQFPSTEGNQLESLENKESWEAVADGMERLTEENREVLLLRDVEGLSAQEAAAVLGIGVTALKSRLHRARKQLRAELGRIESGPKCPDIATVFSQKLEGELSPVHCAELERHIEECASCRGICEGLRKDLRICQAAPTFAVPKDVQERIRHAVERLPRYSRGLG